MQLNNIVRSRVKFLCIAPIILNIINYTFFNINYSICLKVINHIL